MLFTTIESHNMKIINAYDHLFLTYSGSHNNIAVAHYLTSFSLGINSNIAFKSMAHPWVLKWYANPSSLVIWKSKLWEWSISTQQLASIGRWPLLKILPLQCSFYLLCQVSSRKITFHESDYDEVDISGLWLDIARYQNNSHGLWLANIEF